MKKRPDRRKLNLLKTLKIVYEVFYTLSNFYEHLIVAYKIYNTNCFLLNHSILHA